MSGWFSSAVEAALGGGPVTLTAARLDLLDGDDRIRAEQVIFLVGPI